jgi:hypothetical protein
VDENEVWKFQATQSITLNANEVRKNIVSVNAQDDEGNLVSDTDDETVTGINQNPKINIVKTVDANNDNIFNDVENLLNADGTAVFKYVLTNASPAGTFDPLTINNLVDDNGTPSNATDDFKLVNDGSLVAGVTLVKSGGDTDNLLETSESWTYTVSRTVPVNATKPTSTNTGTVYAEDNEGTPATASDTATVKFINYGLIAPTNTTCDEYIAGKSTDGTPILFKDYYGTIQGNPGNGVIQYSTKDQTNDNVNNPTISQTNPGVFFYYTGLSNTIKGFDGLDPGTAPDPMTIKIDQSDPSTLFPAFTATKNDVKLFKVNDLDGNGIDPGDTCTQVQLSNNQITLGTNGDAGDVTVNFTPDAVGSLYVISVKYDTRSVVGTTSTSWPTVKYTFNTDVGNNGTIEETDTNGITIAPKFGALTLNGVATTGGAVLTQDELAPVVSAAVNYWAAQGVDSQSIQKLRKTDVIIGNLGGTLLGKADGLTVYIDDDAAGHGWSNSPDKLDSTRVDLLSAVTHEFGHILGYGHNVMGETLGLGDRHLPLDLEKDLLKNQFILATAGQSQF